MRSPIEWVKQKPRLALAMSLGVLAAITLLGVSGLLPLPALGSALDLFRPHVFDSLALFDVDESSTSSRDENRTSGFGETPIRGLAVADPRPTSDKTIDAAPMPAGWSSSGFADVMRSGPHPDLARTGDDFGFPGFARSYPGGGAMGAIQAGGGEPLGIPGLAIPGAAGAGGALAGSGLPSAGRPPSGSPLPVASTPNASAPGAGGPTNAGDGGLLDDDTDFQPKHTMPTDSTRYTGEHADSGASSNGCSHGTADGAPASDDPRTQCNRSGESGYGVFQMLEEVALALSKPVEPLATSSSGPFDAPADAPAITAGDALFSADLDGADVAASGHLPQLDAPRAALQADGLPEPGTLALIAAALFLLGARRACGGIFAPPQRPASAQIQSQGTSLRA